jgi:hypothetical protein
MYLRARFDGIREKDLSLFSTMVRIDPSLTREEYKRKHRARIEYLARKTTERMRRGMRQGASRG